MVFFVEDLCPIIQVRTTNRAEPSKLDAGIAAGLDLLNSV
jgi:hypothetical protein